MEIFPFEDLFMEIFPWRFILEIFPLNFWKFLRRFFHEDFSFGIWFWRFFLWKMKIFPFEDLFVEIFPWRFILEIFPLNFWKILRRFVHGDFSFGIWFWRFFLWKMEIFPFEDLFMEIFPWRFILRDFSIEVLEIFIENLFIGDFSFWKWRFFFFNDHKVKKMKMD